MVYLNHHHDNRKAEPVMVGGGEMCVCPECKKKRSDEALVAAENTKKAREEEFERLSQNCPWRSCLKCEVLYLAGRYAVPGEDGCKPDKCAFIYWKQFAR